VQLDDQRLISLPFIGILKASRGCGGESLPANLRHLHGEKIYTPVDVLVRVTERHVYVGGKVGRCPGRVIWTPDLPLTKATQAAGGFIPILNIFHRSLKNSTYVHNTSTSVHN
jgi:polysaccharide export outer membrane protein